MKAIFIFSLFLAAHFVYGQSTINLKNEDFLKKELAKTSYEIDTNAKAIILFEAGKVDYTSAAYDYRYEIIAKILKEDIVNDLAEVVITKRDNTNISSITAETYNLLNGEIVKTKLESDNILKDKIDNNLKVVKFNIPNVKKGSIIHYTYKIHRSDVISIPEWQFQNIYPTLFSSYSVHFPSTISFNKILRSGKVFENATTETQLEKCEACEFSVNYEATGIFTSWARKNIPAFEKEPYSSGKDNFLERIKVNITSIPLSNGERLKLFNSWDDFSKKYLYGNENYIGQVFNSNGFLNEAVGTITKNSITDLERAQAIFSYVRSHFILADIDDDNIKSVYKNQKGSVFGINMLLVAMMKKANLNCEPVVLSTKTNERLSPLYPSAYDLNYLVGYFSDKGKEYLLDATERNLPFGILKPDCYNGYARIVNKTGGSVVLSPDNIRDKTTTIVNIEPVLNSQDLIIKVDRRLGIFRSIDFRNANDNVNEAKKNILKSISDGGISIYPESIIFKNYDEADQPLNIHYEAKLKLDFSKDLSYLNPYFIRFYNKNPFTAIQRTLPIELDYNEEELYILNLKLPEQFQVDDFPESMTIKLDESGRILFSNIFNYDTVKNTFSLVSKFQTTTTIYPANEYKDIRSIFEKMIEEQQKKIVITK